MKRETFEQFAVSYLYGEIGDDDRRQLMEWLSSHPEDQLEIDEMRRVLTFLDQGALPALTAEPIGLPGNLKKFKRPVRWRRWITAAAACIVTLLCVSQGVMIQIGSLKAAFGPAVPRAELSTAKVQSDAVSELFETVKALKASNDEMLLRQERLETGFMTLTQAQSQLQAELVLYNQQQFKQFADEFIEVMDQKLRYLYPVTHIPMEYIQTTDGNHSNP